MSFLIEPHKITISQDIPGLDQASRLVMQQVGAMASEYAAKHKIGPGEWSVSATFISYTWRSSPMTNNQHEYVFEISARL